MARGDGPAPATGRVPLHDSTLELLTAEDAGEVAGTALTAASQILAVSGASLWIPVGDDLECRGVVGDACDRLTGVRIPAAAASTPIEGEDGYAVLAAGIVVDGQLAALLRVSRDHPGNGFSDDEQELLQRLADAAGAAMALLKRLGVARAEADERARDLGIVSEMSREITATLDLDRVLRSAVNLASRVISFDRGAIALYEHGGCDIRAVAGADGVDSKSAALQDLAVRAAWAAGNGQHFYLSDRAEPASDAERTFVQIFREDLERDSASSALYLPLKDEEGVIGILLFEAERVDFASEHQRNLAEILANQTTVAVRNALLYRRVPMAATLGALAARKQALFEMPRRRRVLYAAAAVAVMAGLTLIRWPLRVVGADPVLRPIARADVRPTISGVIDSVFVREGMAVARGAPIAHLRDDELARAEVVRSPMAGVVLTAPAEERLGSTIGAGDALVVIGRTDSLELEFGVAQDDVTRVHVGDEVRVRVTALPRETFSGRVASIAPVATGDPSRVRFPVRAVLANEPGLLRPGMASYARVLTEPASALGRLLRGPMQTMRLLWWRMWS